jgi:hypothetical protein
VNLASLSVVALVALANEIFDCVLSPDREGDSVAHLQLFGLAAVLASAVQSREIFTPLFGGDATGKAKTSGAIVFLTRLRRQA